MTPYVGSSFFIYDVGTIDFNLILVFLILFFLSELASLERFKFQKVAMRELF